MTPGVPGALGVAPRSQTETSANQNISLTKVVRYVLGVTKNAFGVTPDPLGSRGHLGFAPGGQTETATNQKISLTKVVRYASGVTKWHLGSPLTHWGPGGTRGGPRGSN